MRRIVLVAVALVAGCQTASAPPADMALACETVKCQCVEAEAPLLKQRRMAEVQWRREGEAYCAAGFELRRVKE